MIVQMIDKPGFIILLNDDLGITIGEELSWAILLQNVDVECRLFGMVDKGKF
jgi:hypothetical protein